MKLFLIQKNTRDIKEATYRESGRVVFAYLNGYHCSEVQVMKSTEDDVFSYSLFDYGKDKPIVMKYLGESANSNAFAGLSMDDRLESIDVGHRLLKLILAGVVSAAVYHNNGDAGVTLPLDIPKEYLKKIQFIQAVLRDLTFNPDMDFLQTELASIISTIDGYLVWNSIRELALLLLREGHLDQTAIEGCMEKTLVLPVSTEDLSMTK